VAPAGVEEPGGSLLKKFSDKRLSTLNPRPIDPMFGCLEPSNQRGRQDVRYPYRRTGLQRLRGPRSRHR